MRPEIFDILIDRYLAGSADEGERRVVEEYLDRVADRYGIKLEKEQVDIHTAAIYKRIAAQISAGKRQAPVISMRSRIIKIVSVAAAVILIASGIWYFARYNVEKNNNAVAVVPDVLPGTTSATLTLANGRKIILDSSAKGLLAVEGGVNINSDNGTINYAGSSSAGNLYNTLTTRRGEQYSALKLSDGTKVWLNAGSSIRFPVAFNSNERKVEITGEAYFEVAKNPGKPFKVILQSGSLSPAGGSTPGGAGGEGGQGFPKNEPLLQKGALEILVLGTSFNINSYTDEPSINATLLEGSIKIISDNKQLQLTPGQQASCKKNNIELIKNIDTEEIIAWKDGLFQFESADMHQVMRQLSRWYDIDVIIEPDVPSRKFFGSITRNTPLNSVLKILSASDVHYKLEGKKLTVTK